MLARMNRLYSMLVRYPRWGMIRARNNTKVSNNKDFIVGSYRLKANTISVCLNVSRIWSKPRSSTTVLYQGSLCGSRLTEITTISVVRRSVFLLHVSIRGIRASVKVEIIKESSSARSVIFDKFVILRWIGFSNREV